MSIIKIDLPSYSFERDPLGSYHEGGTFFPFFRSPIKYNTTGQLQIDFRDSYSFAGSLSANLEWCGVVVESHRKDLEIWKALKSQQDSTQNNDDDKPKGG